MQSRMLAVPALAAGLFFIGPAQAQDTNELVLRMTQELDALKAEIKPLKALLQGAVVAFDRTQATGACPEGWKIFEPAGGRFIVGAGTNINKDMNGIELLDHPAFNDDPVKAVGGEEKHKLLPSEMPSHNHDRDTFKYLLQIVGNYTSDGHDSLGANQIDEIHGGAIQPAGGDQPHNTMPPFVALYYCIKK